MSLHVIQESRKESSLSDLFSPELIFNAKDVPESGFQLITKVVHIYIPQKSNTEMVISQK